MAGSSFPLNPGCSAISTYICWFTQLPLMFHTKLRKNLLASLDNSDTGGIVHLGMAVILRVPTRMYYQIGQNTLWPICNHVYKNEVNWRCFDLCLGSTYSFSISSVSISVIKVSVIRKGVMCERFCGNDNPSSVSKRRNPRALFQFVSWYTKLTKLTNK